MQWPFQGLHKRTAIARVVHHRGGEAHKRDIVSLALSDPFAKSQAHRAAVMAADKGSSAGTFQVAQKCLNSFAHRVTVIGPMLGGQRVHAKISG